MVCLKMLFHAPLALLLLFIAGGESSAMIELNPGCPVNMRDSCSNTLPNLGNYNNLVHARVDADKQTIHYFMTTVKSPAVLVFVTDPTANVSVDWNNLLLDNAAGDSISVTGGSIQSAMGFAFNNLILYNDLESNVADVGQQSNKTQILSIPLKSMSWDNASVDTGNLKASIGNAAGDWFGDQNIVLAFQAFSGSSGYSENSPKLPYTGLSARLDLILNISSNLNASLWSSYPRPRMALEVTLISFHMNSGDPPIGITESKTIDDEYSPGVFQTNQIILPGNDGFFFWKPIVYTNADRSLDGAQVISYDPPTSGSFQNQSNILREFTLKPKDGVNAVSVLLINLDSGDKYFTDFNTSILAMGFGQGNIPTESFSSLVIGVIICAVALPVASILLGLVYVIVSRLRRKDTVGKRDKAASLLGAPSVMEDPPHVGTEADNTSIVTASTTADSEAVSFDHKY